MPDDSSAVLVFDGDTHGIVQQVRQWIHILILLVQCSSVIGQFWVSWGQITHQLCWYLTVTHMALYNRWNRPHFSMDVDYALWLCLSLVTGHFVDKSFQAIDCTGTDNQTITNRKYTEHKVTSPNTNKNCPRKSTQNLNLKQFVCKNCSYQCAYDCTQLCYTIQHRTVLIIFPLMLQTIIIAQMLSNGGRGGHLWSDDSVW